MAAYVLTTSCLLTDLLVREGVCDFRRAHEAGGQARFDICRVDRIETADRTAFVRQRVCHSAEPRRAYARQMGFGDVDERHPNRVDPISMTSRLACAPSAQQRKEQCEATPGSEDIHVPSRPSNQSVPLPEKTLA